MMKKVLVVFISAFSTILSYGQIEKNSNGGIGTGGGLKTCYGSWGLFYNYTPNLFNKSLELNIGTGIGPSESLVFGLGSKLRFYNNSKKIEAFFSSNYSYQLKGKLRYDNENSVDYYETGKIQYLHYYLTGRLWLDDKFAALQLNCGYSQNISGIEINHLSGPNKNYNKAQNTLTSGLLIGVDLIVFLKIKKQ